MKWTINYSRDARRFFEKEDIHVKVTEELRKFLTKTRGEDINIDVKKLKGDWKGYYRLRKGKLRIIFDMDFNNRSLFVEKIDFRGGIYKQP